MALIHLLQFHELKRETQSIKVIETIISSSFSRAKPVSFAVGTWVAWYCQILHPSRARLSHHTERDRSPAIQSKNIQNAFGVEQVCNLFYLRKAWGAKNGVSHQKKRLSCAVHVHVLVYRNMYLQSFFFLI